MEIGTLLIDEKFLPAAQSIIANAQKSIFISSFKVEITSKPRGRALRNFFDTLIWKAQKNVDVRFLINRITKKGGVPLSNFFAISYLPQHGIQVRCLTNERICHAKLLIVDGLIVIIGSHNLSVKSCHNNFEVSYLFHDIYTAGQLHRLYENIWQNSRKP